MAADTACMCISAGPKEAQGPHSPSTLSPCHLVPLAGTRRVWIRLPCATGSRCWPTPAAATSRWWMHGLRPGEPACVELPAPSSQVPRASHTAVLLLLPLCCRSTRQHVLHQTTAPPAGSVAKLQSRGPACVAATFPAATACSLQTCCARAGGHVTAGLRGSGGAGAWLPECSRRMCTAAAAGNTQQTAEAHPRLAGTGPVTLKNTHACRLKPAAELDAAFKGAGLDLDQPLVCTCGTGEGTAAWQQQRAPL